MLPRATLCAVMRLPDHWVWDSWVADDGDRLPPLLPHGAAALEDPSAASHRRARGTRRVPRPGRLGLPGRVLRARRGRVRRPGHLDRIGCATTAIAWRMFYTALSTAGHHIFDQRVGSAVSDDLHHWRRSSTEPALRVDGRWYKTLANTPRRRRRRPRPRGLQRDLARPAGPAPTPTATAGTCSSPPAAPAAGRNDDGVIAHATQPRPRRPGRSGRRSAHPGAGFGQLEVLQNSRLAGRPVLVFTCHPQEHDGRAHRRTGEYCTWSVPGPGPARAVGHDARPTVHCRSRTCSPRRWCSCATAARRSSGSATSSPRAVTASRSSTRSPSPSTPRATWSRASRYAGWRAAAASRSSDPNAWAGPRPS